MFEDIWFYKRLTFFYQQTNVDVSDVI